MSQTSSTYEKIKQHSRWLGILWLIADIGYYIGLLWSLIAPGVGIAQALLDKQRGIDRPFYWHRMVLAFVSGVFVFFFSAWLKEYVDERAEKRWPEIYRNED